MRLGIANRTRMVIPSDRILSDIRSILLKTGYDKHDKDKKSSSLKLTIVFVPEAESKFINRRFLKKNRPANVLSFHYGSEADTRRIRINRAFLRQGTPPHGGPRLAAYFGLSSRIFPKAGRPV